MSGGLKQEDCEFETSLFRRDHRLSPGAQDTGLSIHYGCFEVMNGCVGIVPFLAFLLGLGHTVLIRLDRLEFSSATIMLQCIFGNTG